jgi:hypothetical protein
MSSVNPPTKRKRACTIKKPNKDAQYVCGLLHEIVDLISMFEGEEVTRLNVAISDFVDKHEVKEDESEEDEGEDIRDEDSWSDECSEHSSDRDFIAPSDDEDRDEEYQPSEEDDDDDETQDETDETDETDDEDCTGEPH